MSNITVRIKTHEQLLNDPNVTYHKEIDGVSDWRSSSYTYKNRDHDCTGEIISKHGGKVIELHQVMSGDREQPQDFKWCEHIISEYYIRDWIVDEVTEGRW